MKLPEPVAHMLNGGAAFEMGKEPYHFGPEWDALYTEDQLREALARQEAVMRHVLDVLGPQAPECSGCAAEWNEAIRALEDALK